MKHLKLIKVLSAIVLTVVCGARIYYVNSRTIYPVNKVYAKGTKVDIGNDFFDSSQEQMNGYSIEVIGTELYSMSDFYNEYNVAQDDIDEYYDYIYLVKAKFRNNTNEMGEKAGIYLFNYMLTNNSFMTFSDLKMYKYVNDFSELKFSLNKGTDKVITIPYSISEQKIDIKKFKKGDPQLIISLYPTRKAISL